MSNAWVTIRRFNTLPEARIVQGRLDAEGFHTLIPNENMSLEFPTMTFAPDSVKIMLQVPEEEAENALALIEREASTPLTPDEWSEASSEDFVEEPTQTDWRSYWTIFGPLLFVLLAWIMFRLVSG